MLSDVLRYYSSKRITLAQAYLLSGNVPEAQSQIGEAIRLTPNRLELFVSYIEDLIKEKKCPEAKNTLEHITNVYVNQQFYLELFHRLYVSCQDLQSSLQVYEQEFQSYSTKNAEKIE
jgi:thioredoxin-like negative regulator of GroEL